MRLSLAAFRRLVRTLGPVLGLVLACGLYVSGVHHHEDASSSHACAVCAAGHAPAVTTVAISAAAVSLPLRERVASFHASAPRATSLRRAHSRAPPIA